MFSIVLPAAARNAVRSLVRNHPGYDDAAKAAGVDETRSLTKDQLMAIIESLGLESQVKAIAATMQNAALPVMSVTMGKPVPAFRNPTEPDTEEESEPMPETESTEPADEYSALAESVLDTIRPVLAPKFVQQVAAALEPLLEAAKKPAIEIVRTVTVDESGTPMAPALPATPPARVTGKTTIAKLYGLKGSKAYLSLPVSLWNAADSPKSDPFYVPEPFAVARFAAAIERDHLVWLVGPPGTGKTLMPLEFAARTGRPFLRAAMDRAVEPIDMFGSYGLRNGSTVWVDGKITQAIRKPGTVILLDEITACPPGIAMTLQTLLDFRFLVLASGEVVHCAPGVIFVAADNTNGTGDTTGMYHGTNQANAAMVDRFGIMIRVGYLSAQLEAEALANRSGAPMPACVMLVRFVGSSRGIAGFEAQPLSLRRMVAFMGMVRDGFTPRDAFEDCFLSRMAEDERLKLESHWKVQMDPEPVFLAAMSGTTPPAPAAPLTLEQIAAQKAFQAVDDMS